MSKEKLPPGFTRRASGSLRVQIRLTGHEPVVRNFPISADTADERRRQMAEAKAWAEETRRKFQAGVHVSTREAEKTTLGDAIRKYQIEALKGRKANNVANEAYRIKTILADPISQRSLAQLRKTDVATFRDRLIHAGWLKNIGNAEAKLRGAESPVEGDFGKRLSEIASLPRLSRELANASNDEAKHALERRISSICERESIAYPARTTITNVVQLINRALKHASETMDGVPDIGGVSMPKASAGRERRVTDEEFAKLMEGAGRTGPLLPLVIRFAIATALRRERILTCRPSYIRDIGNGKRAIVFPREDSVQNKRTGVIPVTREITEILEAAALLNISKENSSDEQTPFFDIHIDAFKTQWRRLLDATGIKDLHFHDFRHEATSRLFESGLSAAEVMSITGHSTLDMVDRYSHYSAAIVLKKLEKGFDADSIFSEIAFLMEQYAAVGGDFVKIAELVKKHSEFKQSKSR